MLYFLFLESCTSVEVTKEIIKAGNSVKTTVSEIVSDKENESKINKEKNIEVEIETKTQSEIEEEIEEEKKIITSEQKEQKNIVKTQQQVSEINFLGNSLNEIKKILGESKLAREDGNTYLLRYDSKSCRLFLFFNLRVNNKQVEYFELRNTNGILLESRQSIEVCYKEFNLI